MLGCRKCIRGVNADWRKGLYYNLDVVISVGYRVKSVRGLITAPNSAYEEQASKMNIVYSKAAIKAIGQMDAKTKRRIKVAIEGIPQGDIKPLRGSYSLYRLRAGGRRIVFSYPDANTVLIEKIAPRGGVYKGGL